VGGGELGVWVNLEESGAVKGGGSILEGFA